MISFGTLIVAILSNHKK
ncbi:putative holin-like toxin [Halobacillus naozhouensis]